MPTYKMEYGDQFLSVELKKGKILGSIEAKQVRKIPDLPAKIIMPHGSVTFPVPEG